MIEKSNIDVEANVELATDQEKNVRKSITRPDLVQNDLRSLKGNVLYNNMPMLFDVRVTGYDGKKFEGTSKQWKEYIDSLLCALCNKNVSKCNCTA